MIWLIEVKTDVPWESAQPERKSISRFAEESYNNMKSVTFLWRFFYKEINRYSKH